MKEIPNIENNVRSEVETKILEAIKTFPISSRVELLQLINGLRPVAEMLISSKFKEKLLPSIKFLEDNGFATILNNRDENFYFCYISRDLILAQEASSLLSNKGVTNDRRFGELMGFPQGSIDDYINDRWNMLTNENVEGIIGFHNYFVQLRLSKTNLEESMDYVRRTYKILLDQAPDIFDRGLPEGEDVNEYKNKVSEFVNR